MSDNETVYNAAMSYLKAGLEVIPNHPEKKHPFGIPNWQKHNFTESELKKYIIGKGWNVGIRNIEGFDFDNKGEPTASQNLKIWIDLIEQEIPGIKKRLVVERTKNIGYHVAFKCDQKEGNQKLAVRPPSTEELQEDHNAKPVCMIETRGQGGQFVVAPSAGYTLINGKWEELQTITPEEREILFRCARVLDQMPKELIGGQFKAVLTGDEEDERPGTLYNQDPRSIIDVIELLENEGWVKVYQKGEAIYWRRPGKKDGISASLNAVAPGVFYNFSSNAPVFETEKGYFPFQVLGLLKYDGDFEATAKQLSKDYGSKEIDISGIKKKESPVAQVENIPTLIDSTSSGIKEDKSDWLTADQMLQKKLPPEKWLVDKVISIEGISLFVGPEASGKSFHSLMIADSVANGKSWLDRFKVLKQTPVLIIDKENSERRIQDRLRGLNVSGKNLYWLSHPHEFEVFETDRERLKEGHKYTAFMESVVTKVKALGVGLIVLDSFTDMFQGEENDRKEIQLFVDTLRKVFPKVAFLILHHAGKDTLGKRALSQKTRGSSNIMAQVYTAFHCEQNRSDNLVYTLEQTKAGDSQKMKKFSLRMQVKDDPINQGETLVTGFDFEGEVKDYEEKQQEAVEFVSTQIQLKKRIPRQELQEICVDSGEMTKNMFNEVLKELTKGDFIKSVKSETVSRGKDYVWIGSGLGFQKIIEE